jgi:hypothetical protein
MLWSDSAHRYPNKPSPKDTSTEFGFREGSTVTAQADPFRHYGNLWQIAWLRSGPCPCSQKGALIDYAHVTHVFCVVLPPFMLFNSLTYEQGWEAKYRNKRLKKKIMIHEYMPSHLKQSREGQGPVGCRQTVRPLAPRNGYRPLQSQNLSILSSHGPIDL